MRCVVQEVCNVHQFWLKSGCWFDFFKGKKKKSRIFAFTCSICYCRYNPKALIPSSLLLWLVLMRAFRVFSAITPKSFSWSLYCSCISFCRDSLLGLYCFRTCGLWWSHNRKLHFSSVFPLGVYRLGILWHEICFGIL